VRVKAASSETANLGLFQEALEQVKRRFEPRPEMGRWPGAVHLHPFAGVARTDLVQRPILFRGTGMTTDQLHHRLECLGWRVINEGRQEDDRYYVLAKSCQHYVIALADTRCAAWSAACSLAMKLTREGLLRLPRL